VARDRALRGLDWLRGERHSPSARAQTWCGRTGSICRGSLRGFAASPSGLAAEIEKHITDVTSATAGRLSEWDVLNEPVTNTALQKILGNGAVAAWFETARAGDSAARLYVNDYNLLEGGGNDTPHQAGLDAVLNTLAGAQVDGIGLQAHMQGQLTEPARLYEILTRYAAYKRDLQITELDIDVEDEGLQAEYLEDL
jgi:endo-1,4-beta-xylanase